MAGERKFATILFADVARSTAIAEQMDAEDWALQVADDLYAADRHEFAFEWTELSSANASCQVCWLIGHNEPIMAILCTSFRKVPIPSGIGVSPRSEEARVPA